jgi:hypothetical protein
MRHVGYVVTDKKSEKLINVSSDYEENNQQNALIVSLINLIIYNYSDMFRPLS